MAHISTIVPLPSSAPDLPSPEVESCYFDRSFAPALPAMRLRWAAPQLLEWRLPGGLRLRGPLPRVFGLRIQRRAADCYAAWLRWDEICFHWLELTGAELRQCSLRQLLAALGSDLGWMMDQPVDGASPTPLHAVA